MARIPKLGLVAAIAVAAGCDQPASSNVAEDPGPPPPARFEKPDMVRFHMRRHFDDLRDIERMLVAGKVADAKARAHLLTRPVKDPGIAPWSIEVARVTAEARLLENAPGLDEALRREVRVAQACAECHAKTQQLPIFAAAPPVPPDAPTREARMARHQWAVDRLWEGLVGVDEDRWRGGLEVLASTPLPFRPLDDAPALASQLQRQARAALENRASQELSDRTRMYGEMLVTCAACHATLKVSAR